MAEPWKKVKPGTPPVMKHVLIVDDNNRYAEAISEDLRNRGTEEISRAFNAKEGVEKLLSGKTVFDGIVTDISMEGQLSGLNVIRTAKRIKFPGIITVATTGLDTTSGFVFNRFFLGTIMGSHFLIPKRPIKRDKNIIWIPARNYTSNK